MSLTNRRRNNLNSIWDDLESGLFQPIANELSGVRNLGHDLWNVGNGWQPRLDLQETDSEYRVVLDVPGMKKENITLEQSGNTLTVRGNRTVDRDTTTGEYRRTERHVGEFMRKVQLPESVDTEKTRADLEDGVLTVTLTKQSQTPTRKIEIS